MQSAKNEWTLSKEIAINKGIIGMVLRNRPVYTFYIQHPARQFICRAFFYKQKGEKMKKTAEFVFEKSKQTKPAEDDEFDRNFKFQGLKFGTDFDVKKDN